MRVGFWLSRNNTSTQEGVFIHPLVSIEDVANIPEMMMTMMMMLMYWINVKLFTWLWRRGWQQWLQRRNLKLKRLCEQFVYSIFGRVLGVVTNEYMYVCMYVLSYYIYYSLVLHSKVYMQKPWKANKLLSVVAPLVCLSVGRSAECIIVMIILCLNRIRSYCGIMSVCWVCVWHTLGYKL